MSLDALIDAQFKTAPWAHQLREFETSCELPSRALLWQMRTGKTKMILDTASHLYRAGKIDTLMLFAPNGVHENWWVREAPIHLWDSVPRQGLVWRTRIAGRTALKTGEQAQLQGEWWDQYKRLLSTPDLAIVCFNNEALQRDDLKAGVAKLVAKRKGVMGVWDESTDFRTPGSKRTHMARALARRLQYRRILDGTSLTNSPLHAFAQFELLEDQALGYSKYSTFKNHFATWEKRFNNGRAWHKLLGYQNLDELQQLIAPYSSVVLREDCDDMPELDRRLVMVDMSPQQHQVYEQVKEQLLIELESGATATLKAQTLKLQKLQQVRSGFLIDSERVLHRIPGINPALERVADEVYWSPGKVIVWCQFHEEIDQMVARLRADGHTVWEYHGRISADEKLRVRTYFNIDPEVHVIVGQPQAGGRGVDFSDADHIIWYGHTFDAIIRSQANERATKMGGRNIMLTTIIAAPVDQYVVDTTDRKVDVGDQVAGRGLKAILQEL